MSKTKIKLVAEIGCNHIGQLNLAKLMIDQAKQAGADYVKFQKRDNKTLLSRKQYKGKHPVPHNSFGKTYGDHREYLEFSTNTHKKLVCPKKPTVPTQEATAVGVEEPFPSNFYD